MPSTTIGAVSIDSTHFGLEHERGPQLADVLGVDLRRPGSNASARSSCSSAGSCAVPVGRVELGLGHRDGFATRVRRWRPRRPGSPVRCVAALPSERPRRSRCASRLQSHDFHISLHRCVLTSGALHRAHGCVHGSRRTIMCRPRGFKSRSGA